MEKFDLKRSYPELYSPGGRDFTLVDVPIMHYLAVDGHGDPNTSPEYTRALERLYPVAYSLKFASKDELEADFTVGPLEGLWRAEDPEAFSRRDKGSWDWTMLIAQPEWITPEMVDAAVASVAAKKEVPGLDQVRLLTLTEGLAAQILYIGPYDDEGPVLARLHGSWMPERGLTFNGDHHEVYLSDPRRAAPEKLRTVLRQPVRSIEL
ncbi:GyrI-like domain-containing protein [Arthrobacter sp. zg-Y1171]|uniref:GyrI-like domain-containing protein n=1 Tax=Arthrobacter sp. zg-Y1171 TaxID=2964610 RepID=UPI002104FEB6|nr:GyrI-like domain-containing protein [Arthrobacter sp. zg-Y1171]MCQ1993840.1 GyrI-like domain-containing protein [Arthrobacter sp. zg-Y1171]UWX82032.1 GyrI-like domain-containing protein [Arthrobacter sp. zg-Y1171]